MELLYFTNLVFSYGKVLLCKHIHLPYPVTKSTFSDSSPPLNIRHVISECLLNYRAT